MTESFAEAVEKRLLVCDGATATMFYARGITINRCYEELNLTKPDLVRDLHRDYIKAGADIIETNTFGANRYKLRHFGLDSKVAEINRAGIALASEEARGGVFIAASIGPLGSSLEPYGKILSADAKDAFTEQARELVNNGADAVMFETFHDLNELEIAINAVKSLSKEIPIIAQVAFEQDGKTIYGATATQALTTMESAGADIVGANCSVGPAAMLEVVQEMASSTNLPVIAQPNAGMPKLLDDRLIYLTTPEYLLTYAKRFIRAGARIIGGCCGATPEHISQLKGAALALSPSRVEVSKTVDEDKEEYEETETAEKTSVSAKLAAGEWVRSVELLPPKGADPTKVLEHARKLKEAGIDCINIPDGPRAMARMSPLSLALLFKNDIGVEPILHYTCRDRNLLGMQSDILGAEAVGIKDILAITGDPPKLGNYPNATAVYDVDSIGLVKMIRNLNRGLDIVGNPIIGRTSIHIGVGANPGAANIDEELRRFEQKIESGAEFAMTQPIFDSDKLFAFLDRIDQFKIPVLVGILPLASLRSAEFLHNEVPRMSVPDDIRQRLKDAGENARDVGVEVAREALAACADRVQGVYVMAPVGGADTALRVLSE